VDIPLISQTSKMQSRRWCVCQNIACGNPFTILNVGECTIAKFALKLLSYDRWHITPSDYEVVEAKMQKLKCHETIEVSSAVLRGLGLMPPPLRDIEDRRAGVVVFWCNDEDSLLVTAQFEVICNGYMRFNPACPMLYSTCANNR